MSNDERPMTNVRPWPPIDRWALVLGDAFLVNLAFGLAYLIRYKLQWFRPVLDPSYNTPLSDYAPFMVVLTGLLLLSFRLSGVYEVRRGRSWFDTMYAVVSGTTTAIILMVTVTYIFLPVFYSRLIFLYDGLLIIALIGLFRLALDIRAEHLRARGIGVDRVLIVGAGEVGRMVMRAIAARPELGYQIVGFLDDDAQKGSTDLGRLRALGGLENFLHVLNSERVSDVIITLPWTYHDKILGLVEQAEQRQIRVRLVPDVFQLTMSRVDVDDSLGIPLLGARPAAIRGSGLLLKRALDLIGGGLLFVLTLPLMGLAALGIKLDSPGPVIFKQTRVGKNGRLFTCYKFRSMRQGAEEEKQALLHLNEAGNGPLFKIRDDPRCTRVGRLIRRTSIDELPQLLNVFRGEMSLVGPRPPEPAEVEQYQPWHRQRLSVTPGLTGLWQISGRSDVSFDEMALLDIWYAENWSVELDIKILLKTIPVVLLGRGAY